MKYAKYDLPNTRDVREFYVIHRAEHDNLPTDVGEQEFDRWLAVVKAEAWGRCYNEMHDRFPYPENPFRKEQP